MNFWGSKSYPGWPSIWLRMSPPFTWPIVRPSGFVPLKSWLAMIRPPAPVTFSTMTTGLPGMCLPICLPTVLAHRSKPPPAEAPTVMRTVLFSKNGPAATESVEIKQMMIVKANNKAGLLMRFLLFLDGLSPSDLKLVKCLGRKEFFNRHLSHREALFERILAKRVQRFPVLFDAVRPPVLTHDRLGGIDVAHKPREACAESVGMLEVSKGYVLGLEASFVQ